MKLSTVSKPLILLVCICSFSTIHAQDGSEGLGILLGLDHYHKRVQKYVEHASHRESTTLENYRPNFVSLFKEQLEEVQGKAKTEGSARLAIPMVNFPYSLIHLEVFKASDGQLRYALQLEQAPHVAEALYIAAKIAVTLGIKEGLQEAGTPEKWNEFRANWNNLTVTRYNQKAVVNIPLNSLTPAGTAEASMLGHIVHNLISTAHMSLSELSHLQKRLDQNQPLKEGMNIEEKAQEMIRKYTVEQGSKGLKDFLTSFLDQSTSLYTLEGKINLMLASQAMLKTWGLATIIEASPNNPNDVRMIVLPNEGFHPLNRVAAALFPHVQVEYSVLANHESGSLARVQPGVNGQMGVLQVGDKQGLMNLGMIDSVTLHEVIHGAFDALRAEGKSHAHDLQIMSLGDKPFNRANMAYDTYLSLEEFMTFRYQIQLLVEVLRNPEYRFIPEDQVNSELRDARALLSQVSVNGGETLEAYLQAIKGAKISSADTVPLFRGGPAFGIEIIFENGLKILVLQGRDLSKPSIDIRIVSQDSMIIDGVYDQKKVLQFDRIMGEVKNDKGRISSHFSFLEGLINETIGKMTEMRKEGRRLNKALSDSKDKPINHPSWDEFFREKNIPHQSVEEILRIYEVLLQLPRGYITAPYCRSLFKAQ